MYITNTRPRLSTRPLAYRFTFAQQDATGSCLDLANSPESISIQIPGDMSSTGCFNFQSVFNGSIPACASDLSSGTSNTSCEENWSVAADSFEPSANYSRVFYRQSPPLPEENSTFPYARTEMSFRAFSTIDCTEGTDEASWHQWTGCENEAEGCTALDYNVGSFSLERSPDTECLVGAVEGSGWKGKGVCAGLMALTVGVTVLAVM